MSPQPSALQLQLTSILLDVTRTSFNALRRWRRNALWKLQDVVGEITYNLHPVVKGSSRKSPIAVRRDATVIKHISFYNLNHFFPCNEVQLFVLLHPASQISFLRHACVTFAVSWKDSLSCSRAFKFLFLTIYIHSFEQCKYSIVMKGRAKSQVIFVGDNRYRPQHYAYLGMHQRKRQAWSPNSPTRLKLFQQALTTMRVKPEKI